MNTLIATFCLLFVIAAVGASPSSLPLKLVPRTPYIIRSADDGLVLKSAGGGQICRSAGNVITSSDFENSDAVKWIYQELASYVYFETAPGDFYLNEVTFQKTPFCYPGQQLFRLNEVGIGFSQIEKPFDGLCLTSHGNGVGISWSPCEPDAQNQWWSFKQAL